MTITPEQIAELRAAEKAATPGREWENFQDVIRAQVRQTPRLVSYFGAVTPPTATAEQTEENMRFAVLARNALVPLLDALEAERREVGRLREALYQAHGDLGADCGVTERDCECPDCLAHRAAREVKP